MKIKSPGAISWLLICLLTLGLFFACGTELVKASTKTFGNTAVGNMYNAISTDKDGGRYQLTEAGTVQSISEYFATSGFQAKAAIYTDLNGAPANLIAQSGSESISSAGWHTFSIPSTSLSAGYYWLTVVCSSTSATGRMSPSSTAQHCYKTVYYSNEFSTPFGSTNYEYTAPSIYATYTTTYSSISTPAPAPTTSPSSPLRLMGVDQFSIFAINEANIAAMHQYGANAFRETTYMGDWTYSNYRTKLVQVSQWAAKYDMKFILGCMGTSWDSSQRYSQMLANVIYNYADRVNWISTYGDIIRQVQPYGVNPMNEPPVIADTSYASTVSQAQFIVDYKNFILQCIDSWTAIKPDLVFFVEGSPFYDISTVINSPRIDQSRPQTTIYYSVHYAYSYYNTDPRTWSYYDTAQVSYWTGDLGTARTALFNNFFYNDGVKAALNAGVNVVFEEIGANINNPNVLAYEQDVFDFANTHNISVLWHCWGPSQTNNIGLLYDWTPTLNSMGQVWKANMPYA